EDLDRIDLPGRVLGAAILVEHGAGRIGRVVEGGVAVGALGAVGGEAAAVLQHEQHVLGDRVLHLVGEDNGIAIGRVALGGDDADVSFGADFVGGAVPDDLVGAKVVAFADHLDVAGRGDGRGALLIDELAGAEVDLAGLGGGGGRLLLRDRRSRSAHQ